jgi:hypothetical protein
LTWTTEPTPPRTAAFASFLKKNEAKALPIPLIKKELKEFKIHGAKLQT